MAPVASARVRCSSAFRPRVAVRWHSISARHDNAACAAPVPSTPQQRQSVSQSVSQSQGWPTRWVENKHAHYTTYYTIILRIVYYTTYDA
eukprot:1186662-Prorocentrum_minimum.AAC.2